VSPYSRSPAASRESAWLGYMRAHTASASRNRLRYRLPYSGWRRLPEVNVAECENDLAEVSNLINTRLKLLEGRVQVRIA
jgi:hypothetical protein